MDANIIEQATATTSFAPASVNKEPAKKSINAWLTANNHICTINDAKLILATANQALCDLSTDGLDDKQIRCVEEVHALLGAVERLIEDAATEADALLDNQREA